MLERILQTRGDWSTLLIRLSASWKSSAERPSSSAS